jgi:hypothetical protein
MHSLPTPCSAPRRIKSGAGSERRPQAARGEWPWMATALRSEEVEGPQARLNPVSAPTPSRACRCNGMSTPTTSCGWRSRAKSASSTSRISSPPPHWKPTASAPATVEGSIELTQDLPTSRTHWGIQIEHIAERKTEYRYDEIKRNGWAGRCSWRRKWGRVGVCGPRRLICSGGGSTRRGRNLMGGARSSRWRRWSGAGGTRRGL